MQNAECRTVNGTPAEKRAGGRGEDLGSRTKAFALRVVRLYSSLSKEAATQIVGKQLLRSGTSVGANYREARLARSAAEFVSKMELVLQELDETSYWLDLLVEGGFVRSARLEALRSEADELMAITVSSVRTAKRRRDRK